MLFSGESGEQYGYADTWSKEGLFLYTGEGQEGDMAFIRGNAAIRDHIDNGKDLYLFLQIKKGYVRYIGQMVCTGHHYQAGRDTLGRARRVIIFELTPLDVLTEADQFTAELLADPEPQRQISLADLRAKALADSGAARDAVERQTVYRQRSQWIKQYALQRAQGTCEGLWRSSTVQITG